MTKSELMEYVGKKVHIYFKDNTKDLYGTLGYVYTFSPKYNYFKPNYFYIGNTLFRVSYVKKLVEGSSDNENWN